MLCLGGVLARRRRAPLWMWANLAGALGGFAFLIAAPGNYNRASVYVQNYPTALTKYADRFFRCTNMLWDNGWPLLVAFTALFVLLAYQKKESAAALRWPLILLAGGLCANYAMLLSPDYYARSSHGVFTLLTAACAACLFQLKSPLQRKLLTVAASCLCLLCGLHLAEAGYDIASFWMMDHIRAGEIRAAVAAADAEWPEIESYGIEPYTRWCAAYGLPDIRENGEDGLALYRAKWYHAARLTAAETRTYLFAGHTNAAYEAHLPAANAADPAAPTA